MQLSALTSALGRIVSELQRRRVIRVAAGYAVVGWIILQVAVALEASLNLPAWFDTVVVSLLALGFPVALIAAWFFDFTSEGIKRTVSSGDGAFLKPQTTDWVLIGMLVVVAGIALSQSVTPRTSETAPTVAGEAAKPAAKIEPRALGDKSIAVLPFANLSPDKENEYFADGLTEELLNLLAKVGDLKVISRTSSFAFKGKNTPLPEIAKQLGVRHVLEGSVRAEGEELRVTAQLIDVSTDTHLWSETYERKIQNVFALQDELARDIAGALSLEVTLTKRKRDAPTRNLEAYRLYLEGLERRARGARPSPEASDLFKKATALDPVFAEAYAALAASYATRIGVAPPSEYLELSALARKAARDAIALKPTLGFAHGVLGLLDRTARKWETAVANGEKAVALNPEESNSRLWLAGTQLALGYFDRSAATLTELRRRDPLFFYASGMEMFLSVARDDIAAAESLANTAVHRGITAPGIQYVLATIAYDKGDAAAAERHFKLSLPASLQDRPFVAAVAKAFRSPSAKEAAISAVRAETFESFNPTGALLLLKAYDALFAESNDMAQTPFIAPVFSIIWNARHKSLRGDPRFKALLGSLGLVDYWKKHGWPDRCRPKGEDDFECS